MSTAVAVIAGCTVVTAAIKAVGPVALGGRELPERVNGLITLLAPALLAALVATEALAEGNEWRVGADTAGVAAAGIAAWRGASLIVTVVLAAAVTAALRAL